MISVLRVLTSILELALAIPVRLARFVTEWIAFNPRLGPIRHVFNAAILYVLFALVLVYVFAPLRGFVGHYYFAEKLRYDAERWLATAIYDAKGNFVGTFDPRLDSSRDVNYTDAAIELGDYTAHPDHKSIPVREVPEHYWQCLKYQEDRYLGGPLNPFGIDLLGVLKIPYSIVRRSIALRRPSFGVGGSTLPMQLARVIYKTPPNASESSLTKLRRKLSEWWLAPVIYRELASGGDDLRLRQWSANHLWLAQRTGGAPLHGVEVTSRVVFGKEAKDLSVAEQLVLASAVNKPIILLQGSERLNEVRLDRWRYVTEVRARTCAEKLIEDEKLKAAVLFELVNLAGGPPNPRVRPRLQEALDRHAPALAERAQANPVLRANALLPSARFGIREQMKQDYGFGWRNHVRGVTTTLDVAENLEFRDNIVAALSATDAKVRSKLDARFALDPARVGADVASPHVVVVAANFKGEIVRYYEAGETAPYFGSVPARDTETGFYDRSRESRMIASTGKIIAAIAIANSHRDSPQSLYLDTQAPATGLESCGRHGTQRRGRKAIVVFACSLNAPLLNRTALAGQSRVKALIDRFGFTMPPPGASGQGTPPSTAAVLGQIAGSPRRVHQMAAVVLGALIDRGRTPVGMPKLIKAYDYTSGAGEDRAKPAEEDEIVPAAVIGTGGRPLLRTLLSAPLCYTAHGVPTGTLKSLSHWCAGRRADVRLHFAKTGTQVTEDPDATIDVWVTGGLQFANGAAYSYVVLVGTGTPSKVWGRSLHAAQVGAPLVEVLLRDLAQHAKANPAPELLPARATVSDARDRAPADAAGDVMRRQLLNAN